MQFITSNQNKLREFEQILNKKIEQKNIDLPEIQAIDVKKVVEDKILRAYKITKKPVIVEDTGFYIKSINFPGALIKWVLNSIGNKGICNLSKIYGNKAEVETCIGYHDGNNLKIFSGKLTGIIPEKPKGNTNFGWDPVFIPDNYNKTFAQMTEKEKNKISMRLLALNKLKKFLEN